MRTADSSASPQAHRSQPIPDLAARLQAALQAEVDLAPPIQVRCGLKQGTLLVLAQHPIALPQPRQTLAILEQALRDVPPAARDWQTADLPVRLYLRVTGQTQPYASRAVLLPAVAAPEPLPVEPPIEPLLADQPGQLVQLTPPDLAPIAATDIETPVVFSAEVPLKQKRRVPTTALALAAAIGVTAFGVCLYALTRPCVVGACEPLQQAEQLSRGATQTLATTTSAQAVLDAHQQLNEASYLLETIPRWSKHHALAQAQLGTNATQIAQLDQVVAALQLAQTAAQKSQNPPHPFTVWQEIQQLWQQAIATLEQVRPDSAVYDFAQRKLTEYRQNLTAINQRVSIERRAFDQVANARSTARIAEAREGAATSPDSWQLAEGSWQGVIKLLQQVPQGTMAHAEAQQLLAIYQPKMAAARDRATREAISANAYNEAVRLGRQARAAEQQGRWSEAVEQWRGALTNAQQVPNNTLYHGQAQPLVNAYTNALAQAQTSQRTRSAMQSAAGDLSRTCAGTPKICDYSFGDRAIQVRVTPDYDRAVEQAMVRTQTTGDIATQAEMTAHVNTLLRAIAAISENAKTPIELYNSDGSLFGTYMPEYSGFVAR